MPHPKAKLTFFSSFSTVFSTLLISLFLNSCSTLPLKEGLQYSNKQTTIVSEGEISGELSLEEYEEFSASYAKQLELKSQLEGYYFGHNDEESVYVVLSPYVYKLFTFPEYINLERLTMPLNGLYDVIEGAHNTVSIKDYSDGSEKPPALINLKVNDDGSLYYKSKDLTLDKVGPNFVPGLFHFHRSLEHEEGYIASYDSNGLISMQHDFFDQEVIFDQEALDLTKLGYMYQHGKVFHDGRYEPPTDQPIVHEDEEIPMDKGMALKLYQKAADMNYPPAMHNLATFYSQGIVVEQDKAMAVKWLTAAANAGHTNSEELLATILYWGDKGVPADREYARYLWHTAAAKGNVLAQYHFGDTTFDLEDPTLDDFLIAEFWLEASASKDLPEAYTTLYFINKARGEHNPDSHYSLLAVQYLLQARYLGDPEAHEIYSEFYEKPTGKENETENEEILQAKASKEDSNEALTNSPLNRESFIGHYFTYNEEKEGERYYIILMPHIYIRYEFEDLITFEEFQDPRMGTWGINENKPWLINLNIRAPGSDIIYEEHLEISENRTLKHVFSGSLLTKVGENLVPMLYHISRSSLDKGHTRFYDDGKLLVGKPFSDNKEIYSEKGLELYNAGVLFENGTIDLTVEEDEEPLITKIDLKEALYYYKLSAEMNYPPAMFNLAVFYEDGMGCEPDIKEATKWYNAAAQAGHTESIYRLSKMYHFGKGGLLKDEVKATELLISAAENGSHNAEHNLGLHYLYEDLPLEVDLEKAEKYFRRAASKGHAGAYYQLAQVYYEKISNDDKNDILGPEMVSYFRTAADLGDQDAIDLINRIENN